MNHNPLKANGKAGKMKGKSKSAVRPTRETDKDKINKLIKFMHIALIDGVYPVDTIK